MKIRIVHTLRADWLYIPYTPQFIGYISTINIVIAAATSYHGH